jgi:hypothetical protein
MTGLIGASATSAKGRLKAGWRAAVRGSGPVAVLIGAGLVATMSLHKAGPLIWAAGAFFAAPAHFARHGWAGWVTPLARMRVSWWSRLILLLPSTAVVAVAVVLFNGDGWGFMEGGVVVIPTAMATLFWASFGCALLSAEFAPRLGDEA